MYLCVGGVHVQIEEGKEGKYDRTKDKQVKAGQEWKGAAKTAGIAETKL